MMGGVYLNFLGIDGGGTSTEFIIINQKGKILSHINRPTCHYRQTSLETFEKVIKEGVKEVCNQANISISQIDYSFIGIPGYGEILDDIKDIESIVEKTLPLNSYKCANDAVVAWAGSLGCKPGINIVAGTGAIGFGVDSKNNFARASGWGHFCGDEGSAYWLGKKMIEIFSKEADGRLERTPLYDIVRSELEINHDFEIIDLVINRLEMKRDEVAKLARILYKAAEKEDKFAIEIFSQAAYEHYLTIKSIIEKLDFQPDEKILVSYSGGVFNSGKYILEPLKKYLDKQNRNIELITPILKPVLGAALYAMNISLNNIENNVIPKLKLEGEKWGI